MVERWCNSEMKVSWKPTIRINGEAVIYGQPLGDAKVTLRMSIY